MQELIHIILVESTAQGVIQGIYKHILQSKMPSVFVASNFIYLKLCIQGYANAFEAQQTKLSVKDIKNIVVFQLSTWSDKSKLKM